LPIGHGTRISESVSDDATMASVLTSGRRITYAELAGWPEDGRRYELYDGEVSVVPAPLPRHQIAVLELQDRLRTYVAIHGGLVLVSPIDIVFNQANVLQPDLVVFTAARRHVVQLDAPIQAPPDLAVEVISPGTAATDRGRKLRTFERFGVQEYWLLDPSRERIEVRVLHEGRYQAPTSAARDERFESRVLPGFDCEVSSLFPWLA
jgi:Uma2 family endonuclease